jgi:hypothetical protein
MQSAGYAPMRCSRQVDDECSLSSIVTVACKNIEQALRGEQQPTEAWLHKLYSDLKRLKTDRADTLCLSVQVRSRLLRLVICTCDHHVHGIAYASLGRSYHCCQTNTEVHSLNTRVLEMEAHSRVRDAIAEEKVRCAIEDTQDRVRRQAGEAAQRHLSLIEEQFRRELASARSKADADVAAEKSMTAMLRVQIDTLLAEKSLLEAQLHNVTQQNAVQTSRTWHAASFGAGLAGTLLLLRYRL